MNAFNRDAILKALEISNEELEALNKAKRIIYDRDINPEVNNLMSRNKYLKKPIRDGKLKFDVKIPGYNSNHWYLGFNYDF